MRRMYPINLRQRKSGFTLVEMAVVIIIIGVVLPVIAAILIYTYRDAFISNYQATASSEARRALWFMDDDVKLAGAFSAVLPANFNDAYGPHNLGISGAQAWSYKGDSSTNRVLITRNYATSDNIGNPSRKPVYIDGAYFNCSDQMTYQPELTYVTIYFVHNQTLYRRILTDKTTPLCAGNAQAQLQSCPPYITSGRDSSCQANDEAIASGVSNFDVKYFQLSGDGNSDPVDPTYTSTDPNILDEADFVQVTLGITSSNGAYTETMMQRITKVNQYEK